MGVKRHVDSGARAAKALERIAAAHERRTKTMQQIFKVALELTKRSGLLGREPAEDSEDWPMPDLPEDGQ